ncbi:MAG: hypothetical protein ACI8WB_003764 [Phenylobacterium sp.]
MKNDSLSTPLEALHHDFAGLWQKYQNHFDEFSDTSKDDSGKTSVNTGITIQDNREVFHIFVDFYVQS